MQIKKKKKERVDQLFETGYTLESPGELVIITDAWTQTLTNLIRNFSGGKKKETSVGVSVSVLKKISRGLNV